MGEVIRRQQIITFRAHPGTERATTVLGTEDGYSVLRWIGADVFECEVYSTKEIPLVSARGRCTTCRHRATRKLKRAIQEREEAEVFSVECGI